MNSFTLLCLTTFFAHTGLADSSVGNGGDIFTRYLESTRLALTRSIFLYKSEKENRPSLCQKEVGLSAAQVGECDEFLRETLDQIESLNTGTNPTPFLLRDKPLYVSDVDGSLREVDARTLLGPSGPIEINYHRVKNYSPEQLLQLMIHEFGHKSLYRGNYLEDNLPTRSFSLGRHLLDSASHALAVYAAEKNLIGRYFTLLDHFACNIQVGQTTFGTIGSTQRLFFGDFDHFDTGIGNRPTDFQIFLTESPGVKLFLRINIQERSACNSEDKNGRQTELKIVRMHEHSANVTDQAEIIKSILLPGQNPVCEKTPSLLVIEADSLRFECQYLGASGVFK